MTKSKQYSFFIYSKDAIFNNKKAIRGGIPLVFRKYIILGSYRYRYLIVNDELRVSNLKSDQSCHMIDKSLKYMKYQY